MRNPRLTCKEQLFRFVIMLRKEIHEEVEELTCLKLPDLCLHLRILTPLLLHDLHSRLVPWVLSLEAPLRVIDRFVFEHAVAGYCVLYR